MYTKGVIATTLFVILCIRLGQGIQCYQHDVCVGDACKTIRKNVKQCGKDEQCWKGTSLGSTVRGCGDSECKVQFSIGGINTANSCCSTDLCNSSIQIKITTITFVFMSLIAFMYRSYF